MRIRLMQQADLRSCDNLRRLAGWNQLLEDWTLFLQLSPNGCFVAELNNRVIGTVTTIQYERRIAWIGMLIVHPENRGCGVGSELLMRAIEFLRTDSVSSIRLDATPQGEPLYLKMGFRREFLITRWYRANFSSFNDPGCDIRPAKGEDLPDIVRLDKASFGANRDELLGELQKRASRTVVITERENVVAFAMLRPGANASYCGPVMAPNEGVARKLVNAISAQISPLIWDVPDLQKHGHLAQELGFTPQRTLSRMTLGESRSAQIPEHYWGLIDPALG